MKLEQGTYDNWMPFGAPVFRQIREVQRKLLPVITVFSSAHSSKQYAQVACFGLTYSTTLQYPNLLNSLENINK